MNRLVQTNVRGFPPSKRGALDIYFFLGAGFSFVACATRIKKRKKKKKEKGGKEPRPGIGSIYRSQGKVA